MQQRKKRPRIRESKATTCSGCNDNVPVRYTDMERCLCCHILKCRLCLAQRLKAGTIGAGVCVDCGGPEPADRYKYPPWKERKEQAERDAAKAAHT